MTMDELLEIMQEPEVYNTQYFLMARNRLSDDFGVNIGTKEFKYTRSDRTSLSKNHYNCTKTLLVETLDKMGYPYTVEQDDKTNRCGRIRLAYMGYNFIIWLEDSDFIFIQLFRWMVVDASDVDDVSQVRRAINETNWTNAVTTVYDFDQKANDMLISSDATVQLIPQNPDLSEYLERWLGEFFRAQKVLMLEWKRMVNQDKTHT